MKKFFKFYFLRVTLIGLLLAVQLVGIVFCSFYAFCCFGYYRFFLWVISVMTALRIAVTPCNIPCRIGWITGVLAVPAVFLPVYFLFGRGGSIRRIQKYIRENPLKKGTQPTGLSDIPRNVSRQFHALYTAGGFCAYNNTRCEYLHSGEDMFVKIKEMLSKAESYIFLEFFIIDKGEMWGEILDILQKKAEEGVKIYILRDDLGTICLLPANYDKRLGKMGIESRKFNVFSPHITPDINYRDHRKIIVCDGRTALTGGANLADEYINKISPYGYWKDTAVYLEGEGASAFAQMFIQLWNMSGGKLEPKDFLRNDFRKHENCGYVAPFGDHPSCSPGFSESVFINMINSAQKSVYITTPYLIPDPPLVSALCRAAETGADVRLIAPLIPDKKYIHMMTRANYVPLLKSGVRIYEYLPGFIHAKSVLCDGNVGYVGSANFDYRSLYLHFECGVLMYDTKACKQLSEDLSSLFKASREIFMDDEIVIKARRNIFYRVLRIFSGIL